VNTAEAFALHNLNGSPLRWPDSELLSRLCAPAVVVVNGSTHLLMRAAPAGKRGPCGDEEEIKVMMEQGTEAECSKKPNTTSSKHF
jgi:hypothetical protein